MPSKRFDPTKISVYVDHSTLCAAFKAHRLQGDAAKFVAFRPLIPWLERVASEANLCLSTTQIIELFRWDDAATADAMARWYDRLEIVWTRSRYDELDQLEDNYWTKVAAGVRTDEGVTPFAPSLLTAFKSLDRAGATALLAHREPTLALLQAMRNSPEWDRVFSDCTEEFIAGVLVVADHNRATDGCGWTSEQKRIRAEQDVRAAIRRLAHAADLRLTAKEDSAYATKKCTAGEVQDELVKLYEREPKAIPLFRANQRFRVGVVSRVERGQVVNGQPSNRIRQALGSSFADWLHLVGAAYCDVFTCDRVVSGWIGDLRQSLGFHPQLAVCSRAGGPQGFVRDLMATWP